MDCASQMQQTNELQSYWGFDWISHEWGSEKQTMPCDTHPTPTPTRPARVFFPFGLRDEQRPTAS
jgi:hypothetical protein